MMTGNEKIKISGEVYYTLVTEMKNYQDVDSYVSDWAFSSIWGDFGSEEEIPLARFEALKDLWNVVHMTVRDMAVSEGVSMRAMAFRFAIPYRSFQAWASGREFDSARSCPVYVNLMIAECLGKLPFEVEM